MSPNVRRSTDRMLTEYQSKAPSASQSRFKMRIKTLWKSHFETLMGVPAPPESWVCDTVRAAADTNCHGQEIL